MPEPSSYTPTLLNWYEENARQLPWRGLTDAYAIWISEVMLQQTRVETVVPYFKRWMARFPDIHAQAQAPLSDVLQAWEGLGYYSRARNLHQAAQIIVEQYNGELPHSAAELQKLPGIGRYTAAAIASITFGQDEPTLDGNIRRVLSRLFDVRAEARSAQGEQLLWQLAEEHAPPGQVAQYNQALMDLGATLCTPRHPQCERCPVSDFCQARAQGVQEQRPVKKRRKPIPHHTVAAAIIQQNGAVLIAQRPPGGLLGGLWEFPGGKQESQETLDNCLRREIREELGISIHIGKPFGSYQHAYSHFRVTLHAYLCTLPDGTEPQRREHTDLRWVTPAELSHYPMGKIDRLIATALARENKIQRT